MRIGIVAAQGSPAISRTWSGTGVGLGHGLARKGYEVIYLGPFGQTSHLLTRLYNGIARELPFGGKERWESITPLQHHLMRQVRAQLHGAKCDAALFIGWMPAGVDLGIPTYFYGDATVYQRLDVAPYWKGLSAASKRRILDIERATFESATIFMPTQWAAESVRQIFGQPCHILPFGMNNPPPDEPRFERPNLETLRVVTIGREWERKGFTRAVSAMEQVTAKHPGSTLTILGTDKPAGVPDYPWLDVVGNVASDRVHRALYEADLYIHPAYDEPFGISLSEAGGHGLPLLASDLPSLRERFTDKNQTITLVPVDADATTWANMIEDFFDEEHRLRLAHAAHEIAMRKWTWDAVTDRLTNVIDPDRRSCAQ